MARNTINTLETVNRPINRRFGFGVGCMSDVWTHGFYRLTSCLLLHTQRERDSCIFWFVVWTMTFPPSLLIHSSTLPSPSLPFPLSLPPPLSHNLSLLFLYLPPLSLCSIRSTRISVECHSIKYTWPASIRHTGANRNALLTFQYGGWRFVVNSIVSFAH